MTDRDNKNHLQKLAEEIGDETKMRNRQPWPFKDVQAELPDDASEAVIKKEDLPKAGTLSAGIFNNLTEHIINEMRETVEAQINDAANRRQHALAQMDQLRADVDKVFGEHERNVKVLQEKVNGLAEAVQRKVKEDTDQMLALSERLKSFADSVNSAHDQFFNK
jgi:hypothetical protein